MAKVTEPKVQEVLTRLDIYPQLWNLISNVYIKVDAPIGAGGYPGVSTLRVAFTARRVDEWTPEDWMTLPHVSRVITSGSYSMVYCEMRLR